MDNRIPLRAQSSLDLGSEHFIIKEFIGCGGNAMVYLAEYEDNLHKSHFHKVLLKELFPYDPGQTIYRENSQIIVGNEELFNIHKESFLRGNVVHLNLLYKEGEKVGQNVNSFEKNGTLYTILGYSGGITLQQCSLEFKNLREIVCLMINILEKLNIFHRNHLLHLDISPDNILLMEKEKTKEDRQILLIDYNSSWCLEELTGHTGAYYGVKNHYSAPEIKLHELYDDKYITYSADLFSVCSIFYELLGREPLEIDEFRPRTLQGWNVFEHEPESAVHKVKGILVKGLRVVPANRYQTIEEILIDLNEAKNRIDHKGVTHSSLWEISRKQYKYESTQLLENFIKVEERILPIDGITDYKNVILSGDGGMGKTTSLMYLWKKSIQRYHPKSPVCIYIPLYQYNGEGQFLRKFILQKIELDETMERLEDASYAFDKLLDTTEHVLTLLLDGMNEANSHKRELLKEITEFSRLSSVKILLTTRAENLRKLGLDTFVQAEMLPINGLVIKNYLEENHLRLPSDIRLLDTITNPMMLSLYVKINQLKGEIDEDGHLINTYEEIMNEYLKSLILAQKKIWVGDEAKQLSIQFIIEHLLPQIAGQMKKSISISLIALYKIIERNYKMLKSKKFHLKFNTYTGKSSKILENIKDSSDWFEYAVNEVLQGELAFIVNEDGYYRLIHQNFLEPLKEKNIDNFVKMHSKNVLYGLCRGIRNFYHWYKKFRISKIMTPIIIWAASMIGLVFIIVVTIDITRYVNGADLEQWIQMDRVLYPNPNIDDFCLSPDGKIVCIPGADGSVEIRQVADSLLIQRLETDYVNQKMDTVIYENYNLAIVSTVNQISIFDLLTAKKLDQFQLKDNEIGDMEIINYAISTDGTELYLLQGEKSDYRCHKISKYDIKSKKIIGEVKLNNYLVYGITEDGSYFACANENNDLELLNIDDLSKPLLQGHEALSICDNNIIGKGKFNKDGTYYIKYYPQLTDKLTVVRCSDAKNVFSMNFNQLRFYDFDDENNLIVFANGTLEKINLQSEQRDSLLDKNMEQIEFHLADTELLDMRLIPGTDCIIAAIYIPKSDSCRLLAYDMKRKEIIAKGNPISGRERVEIELYNNRFYITLEDEEEGVELYKSEYTVNSQGEVEFD